MPRLASTTSSSFLGITAVTVNLVAPFESDYTSPYFQVSTDGTFGNVTLDSEATARDVAYWLQYSGGLVVNGSFDDGGFPTGTPFGTLTVTLVKDATGAVTAVDSGGGGEWFVWLANTGNPALAPGTLTVTGTAEAFIQGQNIGVKKTIPAGQVEISAADTALWQLNGGTDGIIRLSTDSDYTAFSQWVQSQGSFGTFKVVYSGQTYYCTFTAQPANFVSNSPDSPGGFIDWGETGSFTVSADPGIGFNQETVTSLSWVAAQPLTRWDDTVLSLTRTPDTELSSGTVDITFDSEAAAEAFVYTVQEVGSIRDNFSVVNQIQPGGGPSANIDLGPGASYAFFPTNAQAQAATSSGAVVTLAYDNNLGGGQSNFQTGGFRIFTSVTYQDPNIVDSYSYASNSATITLTSAVAEALAADLKAGGGGTYGQDPGLFVYKSPSSTQFEGISNLQGSGSTLTFNYASAFDTGDIGAPFDIVGT